MDPSEAARFLHPRAVCLTAATSAPSVGKLGALAFPTLYSLISSELNLSFPKPNPPNPSFQAMLHALRKVPFEPDLHQCERLEIHVKVDPLSGQSTLADFLQGFINFALLSPHSLFRIPDLADLQVDPALEGAYEPDSLIFSFIRKSLVAFHSISFESQARLVHDLRQYTQERPEPPSYSSRISYPASSTIATAALDLGTGPTTTPLRHALFANNPRYLPQPVIEPYQHADHTPTHPLPHPPPDPAATVTATTAQYVIHLESLRRRDMSTTIDALHRYFDRVLFFLPPGKTRSATNPSSTELHSHQYAALGLAVAHAQLGNLRIASAALDDAVRAAHSSDDHLCHGRALAWIAHVEPVIARRHLLLAHGAHSMSLTRPMTRETLLTVFTPVSDGIPHSGSSFNRIRSSRGNASRKGGPSTQRMRSILNKCWWLNNVSDMLTISAAWHSHGDISSALSIARVALSLANKVSPGRVTHDRAHAVAAVSSLRALQADFAGAEAALLDMQAEATRATHTDSADTPIATARPEVEFMQRTLDWLRFERAERLGDIAGAERLHRVLRATADACERATDSLCARADALLDGHEATVRLHLLRGSPGAAVHAATRLCRCAAVAVRPARVVEGLRLCARGYLQAGSADGALRSVLAAVSLSDGFGMELARVRCVTTLAECMLRTSGGDAAGMRAAMRAVDGVVARAKEGAGTRDGAHVLRVKAECALALQGATCSGKHDQVVPLLEMAIVEYGKCEDVGGLMRCWYLLGRVFDCRGEVRRRNAAAKELRKIFSPAVK